MPSEDMLTVTFATADASSVAAFVSERYDLGGQPVGARANRGINDTYVIQVTDDEPFILRLSGRRGRGLPDVAAETGFLAYLDGAGGRSRLTYRRGRERCSRPPHQPTDHTRLCCFASRTGGGSTRSRSSSRGSVTDWIQPCSAGPSARDETIIQGERITA